MTVFTCLRKELNDPAGHTKYKEFVAKAHGIDISIAAVVDKIKQKHIEINFMIATPIVEQ